MSYRLPAAESPAMSARRAHAAPTADEAQLLRSVAARGDETAFERLYHLHRAAVRSAALAIVHDPDVAADIVQRTFVALWQRAPRLVSRTLRLRSWLLTVARNAAIDHLRAASAYVPFGAEHDLVDDGADPADVALESALYAELAPAIATLCAEQRTVIELRYFRGQTFAAIAAATGEPVGTIKSRARLAIDHLRAAIA